MNWEFKIEEDETLDGPDGLKIIQKKGYYRYSQDSLQLVDFADVKKNDAIIDLGTGCGVMALMLAKRRLGRKIVGLEIQKELAEIARKNVRLNCFQEKIEIVDGDIREISRPFAPNSFDYIITNPPYIEARAGTRSSGSKKAIARHEILCNMDDALQAMKYLLKSLRRGACVYPAARFGELILKATNKNLLPKRVQFIYSNPKEKAELVMVEFIKEGKPGLEILPPLMSEGVKD
ncbi:MAG: methyltransferase [Deltaproteobacteria bacterium]|nr:methyltransferase [Deltaproteobacteria bacterium]